jgi:acetolactate synthase regulatory subunit
MSTVDFTGMLVSRVLGVLRSRRCSGQLAVVSTYRKVEFQLAHGAVTAIHSDRPADRLGLQMMKAGDIGVIDLHGALVEQHQQRLRSIATESETSRLGEILVDQKVLNPDELAEALDRYVHSMGQALDKDFVLDIRFHGVEGDLEAEALADENVVPAD